MLIQFSSFSTKDTDSAVTIWLISMDSLINLLQWKYFINAHGI